MSMSFTTNKGILVRESLAYDMVLPGKKKPLRELSLFSGSGGGLLGSKLLGWRTVCAVEIDPYCRSVLLSRQREGHLEPFPIWDDIRTFDAAPWRGHVDIITGGFPCQGISAAGKGLGLSDPRSGLVFEMLSIINEIRPRFVLAENSPRLRIKGLGPVLSALADMGYDATWGSLGAWHTGAFHRRDRLWIVATNSDSDGKHAGPLDAEVAGASEFDVANTNSTELREQQRRRSREDWKCATEPKLDGEKRQLANTESERWERRREPGSRNKESQSVRQGISFREWPAEPELGRVAYGVAHRVDRLRAIGNGQVPRVVALAFETLTSDI